ncbi:copper amine oxidase N-terminal domain-containing protein [Pelotomaculum propionicicum]|uniref:copper amine oxidase N-terminal domain-containing protein n=1 Tax=Pelotomaculum propionicicum TaxID=258475 RepID=UPI003B7CEC14
MFRKLILFVMTFVLIFSFAGIATAQDRMRVGILVESEYAPKGYWSANFFNYDAGGKKTTYFTENPIIENGRMLVPLRQIAEALGYSVIWEPATQAIELTGKNIKGEDINIRMIVGVNQATINSKSIPLDASPKIINGHTMIPLRFISEAMGYFVKYSSGQTDRSKYIYTSIYITDYALLDDSEIDNAFDDDINYYKDKSYPYPHLRNNGKTERGIKLGDSIEKVLQAYPRGLSYPSNYTGTLWYDSWISYQAGSCCLVFSFENGILKDVYCSV